MSKEKKMMGIGSFALLFALLGTVCLIRVNDNSLYNYLFELVGITSQYITPIILAVLSILGIALGYVKKQDWGAKAGMVWSIVNIVLGITVITSLFS